jgi:hypothetical protein
MKAMRTRVHFDVVVTVSHQDEKGLKAAIKSFIACPSHECSSTEGFFYRTSGKPKPTRIARRGRLRLL